MKWSAVKWSGVRGGSLLGRVTALAIAIALMVSEARATPITFLNARGSEPWRWGFLDEAQGRSEIAAFGTRGDLPLLGRWYSSGDTRPGVAVYDSERKEISWRILSQAGRLELLSFGGEGDVILSGGDFDGSGVDDAALAKLVNGRVRWRVRFDPFGPSSESSEERSFVFGQAGDRVFFVSPGVGNIQPAEDWVAVVRPSRSGRAVVRLRNAVTGEVRSFSRFPGRVAEGVRPRPVPMRGSDGSTLLMFPFQSNDTVEVLITTLEGARRARFVRRAVTSIAVGDYLVGAGDEIALLRGQSVQIVSSTGVPLSSPQLGAATELVDEVQVGAFGGGGVGGGVITSCTERSPFDGGEGFVWKPNSDTQFFAVAVLPRSLTGDVERVTTKQRNGTVIKELRFKGVGNGGRTAWQDDALTGAAYKASFGSIQVEVTLSAGGCIVYVIQDPSIRAD